MIKVNFDSEKDTYKTAAGLWQWDYGQVLQLAGLSLPAAVEIHFSLQQSGGDAITRIGVTEDGVTEASIPDELLENNGKTVDYYIYAFVYISDEDSGETVYRISMSVKSRPRPKRLSETTMEALMKAINQIATGKADGLEYKNNVLKLLSGDKELAQVEIAGESSGTISDAHIQTAVNNYLDANPVQTGATTEQANQIAKNTEDISKLSEEMKNVAGGGASASAKNLLITILRNGVYGNDQSDNINALETILFEDSDENNIIVTQSGSTLTISGYMATAIQQSGNVLMVS